MRKKNTFWQMEKKGNKNPSKNVTFKLITEDWGKIPKRERIMGKASKIWTRLRK